MAGLHFVDGMFARSLVYGGLALWCIIGCWPAGKYATVPKSFDSKAFIIGFFAIFGGALLQVFTVTVSASKAPFAPSWRMSNDLRLFHDHWLRIIDDTMFGYYWLLLLVALVIAGLSWMLFPAKVRLKKIVVLSCATMVMSSMTMMGHAGDDGWGSSLFVKQFLHVSAVILWISGLQTIVWFRLVRRFQHVHSDIQKYSSIALWVMIMIVATGVLRIMPYVTQPVVLMTTPYGWLLCFKLCLFMAILLTAWTLRHVTRRFSQGTVPPWDRFDRLLSVELFLMFMIFLTSTLLSQVPQPRL